MSRAQPAACLSFLERLVRTPSLPGREEDVALLVRAEMERLGYDEVRVDEAGNIIGLIRGTGAAPAIIFNTHLDHVDVGDPARWPHPPYGAERLDGRIWGRGAVDIKGPLAAQVHGVADLLIDGTRPPGDVYVTAVVQEEVGGYGAQHLAARLIPSLVVVGEPSRNQLRRGHRGRSELTLHVQGRSVHASVPGEGRNPLEVVATFIGRLKELPMRSDPILGAATVTPTLIRTDQTSSNVVPGEAWLTLDWRTVPGESPDDARQRLLDLVRESIIEGTEATVSLKPSDASTYTGFGASWVSSHLPFLLPADHPALASAARILHGAIGLTAAPAVWRFATDGGHFAAAGHTVVGFGPGDESLAHTIEESIEIAAIERALVGNRALALDWAATSSG